MADTLNVRFINCLYYKINVFTDVVLKYFLEYCTTLIAKYQTYCHAWRPLACYAFIQIKFAQHYLLLSAVCMCQKSLNFVDAFNCYKQK